MNTIALICRACEREVKEYRHTICGRLFYRCEKCGWFHPAGGDVERLQQLAYGRNRQ